MDIMYIRVVQVTNPLNQCPISRTYHKIKYFVHFLIPRNSVSKLMELRSHTFPLQYISLQSILASALLMMLQRYRMICLMIFVLPLLSTYSERSSEPISLHKHVHPDFCFSEFLSMALTPAMILMILV